MRIFDWSSDVCSADLSAAVKPRTGPASTASSDATERDLRRSATSCALVARISVSLFIYRRSSSRAARWRGPCRWLRGVLDPVDEIVGRAGDDEGFGGVVEDGVAIGAGLAHQQRAQRPGVIGGVAAANIGNRARRPKIG